MENSLSPAFVKINYQSKWSLHTMTIPSVPLNNMGVVDSPPNFDLRGLAVDVDAEVAVVAFVNALKPAFSTDTTFVDYTIFSQPLPTDIPTPVWSAALGIAGTFPPSDNYKAVQATMSFRATDFTLFKLVLLDQPNPQGFDVKKSLTGLADFLTIKNYVTADVTWLASRGGGRPSTFLQLSTTLNEKLRRSYKMN